MSATTKQINALLQEMQRMSARLQAAEQAAADAGTRVQQAEQAASRKCGRRPGGGSSTKAAGSCRRSYHNVGRHKEIGRIGVSNSKRSCVEQIQMCALKQLDTAGIPDQPVVMADISPPEQEFSRQVYLALCLQVSGVAMTKLQNVEAHNGLEAWRQLEFEPRTTGRRRLHVTGHLCPAKTNNMEKLGETIEQREREVRDYERVYKKALDEEIKIGVLTYLAPDKVSEHLSLFADKLQSYADAHRWTWTP
eukprot:3615149-Amphidinium_carterae.1